MKNHIKIIAALLMVFLAVPTLLFAGGEVEVVIMATADVHARIFPIDHFTGESVSRGMAMLYTLVKDIRAQNTYTLLIDAGDTVEGSNSVMPTHYEFDPLATNPMAKVMNLMGYDAWVPGNHEFQFGLDVLNKITREINFSTLCANILNDEDYPYFAPYAIKTVGPIKVGILGLSTPITELWERPQNKAGLHWADPVEIGRQYVPEMREAGADIIVVLQHSGWDKKPTKTRDPEAWKTMTKEWIDETATDKADFVVRIAEGVPGVDVIIASHNHYVVPQSMITGPSGDVLVTEPGKWAERLSVITLVFEEAEGKWALKSKASDILSVKGGDVEPDKEVLETAQYYLDQTTANYNAPVAELIGTMPGGFQEDFYDSTLIELLNEAQLWATNADISAALLGDLELYFKEGPITIGKLNALFPWANTLFKLEITGEQLKAAMEHSTIYYNTPTGKETSLEELAVSGKRGRCYQWQGVDYVVDITKPVGERIIELKYKGEDVKPDQVFTLATNSHIGGGAFGYTMFSDVPLLWQSQEYVGDIATKYVKEMGQITAEVDDNWYIIPDLSAWIESALEARRAAIEGK